VSGERGLDHPLRPAAEADLARLIPHIERLSGLWSHWRGVVLVRDVAYPFSGQKHGWCGISLREDVLLDATLRWRTMIHEGLHSVSGAFSPGRPDPMSRRWEEAIVEQMQRLRRQRVLRAAGVEMDDEVFLSADNEHGYNLFIRALEAHRRRQGAEIEAFYLGLLRADAAGRAGMLVAATRALRVQRWQELL